MGFPLRVSARLSWLIWVHRDNKRVYDRVGRKVDVCEYNIHASAATAAVSEWYRVVVTDEILCAVLTGCCLSHFVSSPSSLMMVRYSASWKLSIRVFVFVRLSCTEAQSVFVLSFPNSRLLYSPLESSSMEDLEWHLPRFACVASHFLTIH